MVYLDLPLSAANEILGGSFSSVHVDPCLRVNTLYFAANRHVVKIGKSWNPGRRVADLNQPLSFSKWGRLMREPLDILLCVDGSNERHETNLHRRFADIAIASEWYSRDSLLGWFFDRLVASAARKVAA